MGYNRHFAPKVKQDTTYMPPLAGMRVDITTKPVCRTRGRLDVTADITRVTCGACKTRAKGMGIDISPKPEGE